MASYVSRLSLLALLIAVSCSVHVAAMRDSEQNTASPLAWVKPELADSISGQRAENQKQAMEAASKATQSASSAPTPASSASADAAFSTPELVNDATEIHANPTASHANAQFLETEASTEKAKKHAVKRTKAKVHRRPAARRVAAHRPRFVSEPSTSSSQSGSSGGAGSGAPSWILPLAPAGYGGPGVINPYSNVNPLNPMAAQMQAEAAGSHSSSTPQQQLGPSQNNVAPVGAFLEVMETPKLDKDLDWLAAEEENDNKDTVLPSTDAAQEPVSATSSSPVAAVVVHDDSVKDAAQEAELEQLLKSVLPADAIHHIAMPVESEDTAAGAADSESDSDADMIGFSSEDDEDEAPAAESEMPMPFELFPPVPQPELDEMPSTEDLPVASEADADAALPHNADVMDASLSRLITELASNSAEQPARLITADDAIHRHRLQQIFDAAPRADFEDFVQPEIVTTERAVFEITVPEPRPLTHTPLPAPLMMQRMMNAMGSMLNELAQESGSFESDTPVNVAGDVCDGCEFPPEEDTVTETEEIAASAAELPAAEEALKLSEESNQNPPTTVAQPEPAAAPVAAAEATPALTHENLESIAVAAPEKTA